MADYVRFGPYDVIEATEDGAEVHSVAPAEAPPLAIPAKGQEAWGEVLCVERHFGKIWLCAVRGDQSKLLSEFKTKSQADRFQAALNLMLRASHERGALGI